jgi:hypothetical protein
VPSRQAGKIAGGFGQLLHRLYRLAPNPEALLESPGAFATRDVFDSTRTAEVFPAC